jgi:UDP-N-acetylglucosamine acyltransferase
MAQIHPTALVDRRAELAEDVCIGAYSIIKAGVTIGPGTVVHEQCHIHGNTTIGSDCSIGPAAYVGLAPQHLKHDGLNTHLIIGDNVIIRETASVHRSIDPSPGHATRIGNRCMIMVAAHVGHDSQLGEDVMLANAALVGGHVQIGDKVFVGGGSMLHQFVRVGRLAILAGNEASSHDIPPFGAMRYRGLKGYNAIGCKRAGFPRQTLHAIRTAYHCLHANRTLPDAIAEIRDKVPMVPEVVELLDFLTSSRRGILPSVKAGMPGMDAPLTTEDDLTL